MKHCRISRPAKEVTVHKEARCASHAKPHAFGLLGKKNAPGSVKLGPRLAQQINGGLEASPPLGE
jgi:hypothetical protein